MTTKNMIREWLEEGKKENATHMIVVCDTFDYEDYPVYVKKEEDVNEIAKEYNMVNMQRIMEVYSYALDLEKQLAENRVFNY